MQHKTSHPHPQGAAHTSAWQDHSNQQMQLASLRLDHQVLTAPSRLTPRRATSTVQRLVLWKAASERFQGLLCASRACVLVLPQILVGNRASAEEGNADLLSEATHDLRGTVSFLLPIAL